jgi:hypothetical protein
MLKRFTLCIFIFTLIFSKVEVVDTTTAWNPQESGVGRHGLERLTCPTSKKGL